MQSSTKFLDIGTLTFRNSLHWARQKM